MDAAKNASDITKRPSGWRKNTRPQVEAKAPIDDGGNMMRIGCDSVMPKADLDHHPPLWERRQTRNYDSRKEFLDDYNNIDELRLLCPSCNRGHQFENIPTENLPYYQKYFGD